MIKHILIFFLLLSFFLSSYARIEKKREFQNFDEGGALIHCFFQDSKGMVWVGTSYGLGIYDGKGIRKHRMLDGQSGQTGTTVYCSLKLDDTHYYLGTEKGLLLFDLEQDTSRLLSAQDISVRTLQRVDDSTILLGTLTGLYQYDCAEGVVRQIDTFPQLPIDPIVRLDDRHLLIASYQHLYLYDIAQETFTSLPVAPQQSSTLLSIAVDTANQWAWIGTENGLWKYDIASGSFLKIEGLSNNIIKKIHIGTDGLLWLGTDGGLYIYDWKTDAAEYLVHTSKDNKSLVNNIIWAIFQDAEQNIWLGTDSGISLYHHSHIIGIYSWDSLIGSDEGNNISCIYRDSRNNYWWGGSNGLGYCNEKTQKPIWFKMGQHKNAISHNRIRCIYEDWDGDLWVATDGGINRFDYETETFENYQIMDSTRTLNANWTYYINGDGHTNLYVAAYCGGVFVVDKQALLSRKGKIYIAGEHYCHQAGDNSLHSNFIQNATIDTNGCLWVSMDESVLEKIDLKEKKVHSFPFSSEKGKVPSGSIKRIIHDQAGNVWIAMNTCLCRIEPGSEQIDIINTNFAENEEILCLEEDGNRLWVATSRGIYVYDKFLDKLVYTGIGGSYLSLYNDRADDKMWIGGIDQCLVFKKNDLLRIQRNKGELQLSGLYINEKPVYPHELYNQNKIADRNINSLEQIHLLYNQNNIAFDFVYTQYDRILQPRYVYRLKGEDVSWRNIDDLGARISYTNLKSGDYVFELKELGADERADAAVCYRLDIVIDAPWYWNIWTKVGYFILLCLLILWVVKYFYEKNRFRIEHMEREKTLELSNLKMEFLTNMSHELKTPLSLIIAPISQLLAEAKSAPLKEKLLSVHSNALKLDSIIHQILDLKDWAGMQQKLYPSPVEPVTVENNAEIIQADRIQHNGQKSVHELKEEEIGEEVLPPMIESQDEKFLNYITEIIEQHLSSSDLNVTKLAELSGYSSKQIYRRIKQLTGYTAVDYIKGIRMKRAAMLLSQKKFMVSEVMYMVGFSDSSYFSKCFVEKYGKTPKLYMETR